MGCKKGKSFHGMVVDVFMSFHDPKQEHGIKEQSLKMVFSKIIQSIRVFLHLWWHQGHYIAHGPNVVHWFDWIPIKNEHSRSCNHPKQRKIGTKRIWFSKIWRANLRSILLDFIHNAQKRHINFWIQVINNFVFLDSYVNVSVQSFWN